MPPPMTGMRTAMGTAAGGGLNGFGAVRDGKATEQIYVGLFPGFEGKEASSPLVRSDEG